MTTPENITDAALAKNRKNQPGVLASAAELFDTFKRIYPVIWTIAARVNRTFFGDSLQVSPASNAWARPSQAELIFRIEATDGSKVQLVDLEERDAEPEQPAVYEWGQSFLAAGNANDPDDTADDLVFYYSKIPDTPSSATDPLEDLWPEHFNELLVLEIALVLAIKDEREHEIGVLTAARDTWLRRFIAHLEHATTGVVASRDHNRYRGSTMIPLQSLLAGGTSVEL